MRQGSHNGLLQISGHDLLNSSSVRVQKALSWWVSWALPVRSAGLQWGCCNSIAAWL